MTMSGLKTSVHEQQKTAEHNSPARSSQPERMGLVYDIQALQRTAGNRAVTQLLQQMSANPTPVTQDLSRIQVHNVAPVRLQAKLAIGQVGDKYEQEADRVADTIMRMPDNSIGSKAATYP